MKEYLLDNGFTEITKNQYQLDDNIVVIRGKRVDVFIGDEWLGTAEDIEQLKALLYDI